MRYRNLLAAVVGIAVAFGWANAQAQFPGLGGPGVFYFGPEGGWTNLQDQNFSISGGGGNGTIRGSDGFNIGARGGIMFGPLRLEEEYSYRRNSISGGSGATAFTGNVTANALMTNLLYDFGMGWVASPHLGVGVGAVKLNLSRTSNNNWLFGYQGIAGVRYNINPALAFDLDYRYLGTTDPTFSTGGRTLSTSYGTHNVVASLTMLFGAAPPPPVVVAPAPPAPPPPARKVFLVFFDWDRDTITPEGMAIVQQAADAFKSGAPVRIMVTGYTDRSGSPGYNQRLSERRANNVANAMSRMGVPRDQMAVSGRGENDNRVPTADGVREPQNRRVEIVFP